MLWGRPFSVWTPFHHPIGRQPTSPHAPLEGPLRHLDAPANEAGESRIGSAMNEGIRPAHGEVPPSLGGRPNFSKSGTNRGYGLVPANFFNFYPQAFLDIARIALTGGPLM